MTGGPAVARILIVDDEALIAMALAYTLESQGHEVRTAADGRKALDVLDGFRPDVMITDYMMPRMDGAQLVQAVRARPDLRAIRIIMLTALDEAMIAKDAVAYDLFARKPFLDDEIVGLVARLTQQADRPRD